MVRPNISRIVESSQGGEPSNTLPVRPSWVVSNSDSESCPAWLYGCNDLLIWYAVIHLAVAACLRLGLWCDDGKGPKL